MNQITSLTTDPKQQFNAVISGYNTAQIYIEYKPQQFGWFMNLVWGNFSVNNLRLAVGPNILRQFKNQIPFGIAISGVGNIDPLNQTDWVSNNGFFILTSDDVAAVETVVYG